MSDLHIALIGNPNCGKTTLFNVLTGSSQRVGNWPGVTVDRKEGHFQYNYKNIAVVDLPGIYSLSGLGESSLDEKIARDYILSSDADLVVNIVDASNLERNLYLTAQLLEMRVPLVVVLNMSDVAHMRGIKIDVQELSKKLGCPVVSLIATKAKAKGKSELLNVIYDHISSSKALPVLPEYTLEIEAVLKDLEKYTSSIAKERHIDTRWLGIKILEEDDAVLSLLSEEDVRGVTEMRVALEKKFNEDADTLIADNRYSFVHALVCDFVKRPKDVKATFSDKIDHIVLNRFFGLPVFLLIMYGMFLFTINFASAFIDFFDILTGTIVVDGTGHVLESINAPAWLIVLLADGIGGGIQTVATFIPVIGFLFLFLTFLEDSGYMSRAAFVMDRAMRVIGLPGKSFVPMILGFGCTVPAIMAARTLESKRDRIMTIMMSPFMSCGARLPVYSLFAAAFFPYGGQNIVFLLYLLGIAFAVLTGLVLKHTLLKGEAEPFIMELPAYHVPTLRSLLTRTWNRLFTFMFKAGKILVLVVVVLSFLNSWGVDGSFGNEDSENSVLSVIGKSMTPIVRPIGISEENWPASVGLFTGIFAKEVVVGTLDVLYSQIGDDVDISQEEDDAAYNLYGGVREAFSSISPNLQDALVSFSDPLGLDIGDVSSIETASEAQEVSTNTFGIMQKYFDGKAGALAYMIIILLYMPCVAAIAAVLRETSVLWTMFILFWSTGLGYGAAVMTYQMGTFAAHPQTSLTWSVGVLVVFVLVVLGLKYIGKSHEYKIAEQSGKV